MCVESNTWLIAVCVESDVLARIKNADHAKELLREYRSPGGGNSRLSQMAERYFEDCAQFHIESALSEAGTHLQSKLSAIRTAICRVLDDYITDTAKGGLGVLHEPVAV